MIMSLTMVTTVLTIYLIILIYTCYDHYLSQWVIVVTRSIENNNPTHLVTWSPPSPQRESTGRECCRFCHFYRVGHVHGINLYSYMRLLEIRFIKHNCCQRSVRARFSSQLLCFRFYFYFCIKFVLDSFFFHPVIFYITSNRPPLFFGKFEDNRLIEFTFITFLCFRISLS